MLGYKVRIAKFLERDPHTWWGGAVKVISTMGKLWAREYFTTCFSHLEAILRASAPTRVHHAAWDYLHDMAMKVSTDREAYQILSSLLNDEKREGGKHQSLHRLRRELSTKETKKVAAVARRQIARRLMREMQNRRMAQRMRDF